MLDDYAPRSPRESADLVRVKELLLSEDAWSRGTPLHITGSALVVHPRTQRVLLRWHERQQAWLQVGGHGDPGETDALVVALREAAEETGLSDLAPWPSADPVQVAIVPVPAGKGEPAHQHADVRYVLATSTPDAVRPENPAARLRWLRLPEAHAATSEDNLRECLGRVGDLLREHARCG
jgi:8-oxo-dGTP pyrophosphatase MutT (NUDIX family)